MKTTSYNLVHALREVADKHGKNQADIARTIGENHVYVSRVFNGTQPNLTGSEVEKIAEAISSDEAERAVLLRAYLLDRLDGVQNMDLVRISISGEPDFDSTPKSRKPLDPKFRTAVEHILELGVQHIEVAKMVIQFVQTIDRLNRPR